MVHIIRAGKRSVKGLPIAYMAVYNFVRKRLEEWEVVFTSLPDKSAYKMAPGFKLRAKGKAGPPVGAGNQMHCFFIYIRQYAVQGSFRQRRTAATPRPAYYDF
jgi:hypothetical protein